MVSQIIESMEKKKRIVTKIGNVFCVEVESQYKMYFQYVANDMTQLNSSVIRVFKTKYAIDAKPDIESIVNDEVWFYAHAILRMGIADDVWYKCGKSKNIGTTENITFRSYSELFPNKITVSHNWYIWKINQGFIDVGTLPEEYRKYDMGSVYTPYFIYEKIKTGKFPGKEML